MFGSISVVSFQNVNNNNNHENNDDDQPEFFLLLDSQHCSLSGWSQLSSPAQIILINQIIRAFDWHKITTP